MKIPKNKYIGLLLLILIASTLIFINYGDIIKSPGNVFFSSVGDGIKSTYGSYYHLKYDTTYMHTNSMNYPYGESVFFTGCQPLFINLLKSLPDPAEKLPDSMLGILNIWMIFSILLGIIVIYFLLTELNLPVFYALPVSLIIAFLSPQIRRFSGHYDLAYLFVIPLILLLLLRYYKNPSVLNALIAGFSAFVFMYIHGYFFAFYSIWVIIMLIALSFGEKERFPLIRNAIHLLLFIGVPLLLYALLTHDPVTDRPAYPWGAVRLAAHLEAIFLPVYNDYLEFLPIKSRVSYYIGITSTVIFIILIRLYIKDFKNRAWYIFFENRFLNAIFLGAIVTLIYSLAFPFNIRISYPFYFDSGVLLNYTGPLRQFRATGRFSWMFYYVINLMAYYYIGNYLLNKKRNLRIYILFFILLIGALEAYLNIKDRGEEYNNRIPELEDSANQSSDNLWVNRINFDEYQAILPLPYFHIGSENFWLFNGDNIERASFVAAWKTGLPLMSVRLSRTSLSQTIKSIGLVLDPLESFEILDDLPSGKDLLIVHTHDKKLKINERRILEYAELLYKYGSVSYYRLSLKSLDMLHEDYLDSLLNKTANYPYLLNRFFSDGDSLPPFIFNSFGINYPNDSHQTDLLEIRKIQRKTIILDTTLWKSIDPISISFWINRINQDLIPRTEIKMTAKKKDGSERKCTRQVFEAIQTITREGWGLVELFYQPTEPYERLIISINNPWTTNERIKIDDLLLKPKSSNLYFRSKDFYFINNRYIESDHNQKSIDQ